MCSFAFILSFLCFLATALLPPNINPKKLTSFHNSKPPSEKPSLDIFPAFSFSLSLHIAFGSLLLLPLLPVLQQETVFFWYMTSKYV